MAQPILEVRGVSKLFPENGVQAVDTADLALYTGEVHGLIGENGAGKSTLMQVIAGVLAADSGELFVHGTPLANGSPAESRAAGIVMSYQHPRVVRELTVLENLFLGEEPRRWGVLFDRRAAATRVTALAPDLAPLLARPLGRLSSGQIRTVSLVAALLQLPPERPGILILDEPTEATTPLEVDHIFEIIRRTASAGHAVVLISHKLPEVVRVADAVTVLRAGRSVTTFRDALDTAALAAAMVGDETPPVGPASAAANGGGTREPVAAEPAAADSPTGCVDAAPRLRISNLFARERGRTLLADISMQVCPGEIVGLTGIRENGIEAMEELLAGRIEPSEGVFEVDGVRAGGLSAHALRRLGLRYVPTDRLLRGASVQSSVSDNLIALRRGELQRGGLLDPGDVRDFAGSLRSHFGIEGALHVPLWQLSGGNIQKVILSRELEGSPRLLVICEPSWGLDFRSRERIVERIKASAMRGAAVVVISTDIDEILDLSTRIGVLYDGRMVATFDRENAGREAVGRAMAGASGRGTR